MTVRAPSPLGVCLEKWNQTPKAYASFCDVDSVQHQSCGPNKHQASRPGLLIRVPLGSSHAGRGKEPPRGARLPPEKWTQCPQSGRAFLRRDRTEPSLGGQHWHWQGEGGWIFRSMALARPH